MKRSHEKKVSGGTPGPNDPEERIRLYGRILADKTSRLLLSDFTKAVSGEEKTFTHLKKKFNLNPNALSRRLKIMENAGLITSHSPNYTITPEGRNLLEFVYSKLNVDF